MIPHFSEFALVSEQVSSGISAAAGTRRNSDQARILSVVSVFSIFTPLKSVT